MRLSTSAVISSHSAVAYWRMTIVPRTGPFSASSALATTSWYQRGKSSACGVSTGAFAMAAEATYEQTRSSELQRLSPDRYRLVAQGKSRRHEAREYRLCASMDG